MAAELDTQIWKLYKHLGSVTDLDVIPDAILANYLMEHVATMTHKQVIKRIQQIRTYRQALAHLKQQPQVAQRSPEWYELRRNRLTASDMAQAMGRGKFGNRAQLLKKKAFPDDVPFNMNSEPLKWGVMFEPIASRSYSQRMDDIVIHEFGLIPHPTLSCFGASPDGITDLGIMVEFKCPWRRKIDGNVLEQYEIQMQGQMAVCGLEECHFVECDIQKLDSEEEYMAEIGLDQTVDHGIIVEYPEGAPERYIYSPEYMTPQEAIEWVEAQKEGRRVYWKLRKYHMCCVKFDKTRWEAMIPQVVQFWKDVEDARNGSATASLAEDPIEKPKKFKFIEDEDDVF